MPAVRSVAPEYTKARRRLGSCMTEFLRVALEAECDFLTSESFFRLMAAYSRTPKGRRLGLDVEVDEKNLFDDAHMVMPTIHYYAYETPDLLPLAAWDEFVHLVNRYRRIRAREGPLDLAKFRGMVMKATFKDITSPTRDWFEVNVRPVDYIGHVYPVFGFLGDGVDVSQIAQAPSSVSAIHAILDFYNHKLVSDLFTACKRYAMAVASFDAVDATETRVVPERDFIASCVKDLERFVPDTPLFRLSKDMPSLQRGSDLPGHELDRRISLLPKRMDDLLTTCGATAFIDQEVCKMYLGVAQSDSPTSRLAARACQEMEAVLDKHRRGARPKATALFEQIARQKQALAVAKECWQLSMSKAGSVGQPLRQVFEELVSKVYDECLTNRVTRDFEAHRHLQTYLVHVHSEMQRRQTDLRAIVDAMESESEKIRAVAGDLVELLASRLGTRDETGTRRQNIWCFVSAVLPVSPDPRLTEGPIFESDVLSPVQALSTPGVRLDEPLSRLRTLLPDGSLPDLSSAQALVRFSADSYVFKLTDAARRALATESK